MPNQGSPGVNLETASRYSMLDPADLAGLVVEAVGLEPDTDDGARVAGALTKLLTCVDTLHENQGAISQRTADGLTALANRLIGPIDDVFVQTPEGGL